MLARANKTNFFLVIFSRSFFLTDARKSLPPFATLTKKKKKKKLVKKLSYCYCVFHGKSCPPLFYPLQENKLDLFESPENTKAGQICANCNKENIAPFRNEARLSLLFTGTQGRLSFTNSALNNNGRYVIIQLDQFFHLLFHPPRCESCRSQESMPLSSNAAHVGISLISLTSRSITQRPRNRFLMQPCLPV